MAYNNTVILTGSLGGEAKFYETKEAKPFATVSLATTDSYQDSDENWVQRESVWHDLISFTPTVIATLKSLKKGTRVKVFGSLSYRPFETVLEDGQTVTKKETSILVHKVELAPLVKKNK